MIHTFQISYALSLSDANLCAYRLNERTRKYEGYKITKFLDISKNRGSLIFTLPELIGIKSIELLKYKDRDTRINFRIYFIIEAQLLLTGTDMNCRCSMLKPYIAYSPKLLMVVPLLLYITLAMLMLLHIPMMNLRKLGFIPYHIFP